MNRTSKSALGLLCLCFLAATSMARADTFCTGSVHDQIVHNDGVLMIRTSWFDSWTYLCSMQAPYKGVSTESCYAWLALLVTAKTLNKNVGILYFGDATCATLGNYGAAPAAGYVQLVR